MNRARSRSGGALIPDMTGPIWRLMHRRIAGRYYSIIGEHSGYKSELSSTEIVRVYTGWKINMDFFGDLRYFYLMAHLCQPLTSKRWAYKAMNIIASHSSMCSTTKSTRGRRSSFLPRSLLYCSFFPSFRPAGAPAPAPGPFHSVGRSQRVAYPSAEMILIHSQT